MPGSSSNFSSFLRPVTFRIKDYSSKVNGWVFSFIVVFTIGAWLDLNGVWCEMPIMVNELPEGWRLGSIINFTIQIAQLTSLLYLLFRWLAPGVFTYERAILVILSIGALSCFLLAFFWSKTAFIFGEERSIGLYVLNFCLAILDGTSSITFLPYIGGNFVKEYIIPNYIGEMLAALLPTILSLSQGLGQDPVCQNVTRGNKTELEQMPITPNFSVSVYFILMFLILCASTTAFSLLHYSSLARRHRKSNNISSKINQVEAEKISINNQKLDETTPALTNTRLSPLQEKLLLLGINCIVAFLYYGFMPGIQSYSTLPYGNQVLFYSINLSNVGNFIVILLSIWSYNVSILRICIEFGIGACFSVYILANAIMSPCPILLGETWGQVLAVVSQIAYQLTFMRVRCLIATRLERFGQRALVWIGATTMISQISGGVLVYILVNVLELFESRPNCVYDFVEYCRVN